MKELCARAAEITKFSNLDQMGNFEDRTHDFNKVAGRGREGKSVRLLQPTLEVSISLKVQRTTNIQSTCSEESNSEFVLSAGIARSCPAKMAARSSIRSIPWWRTSKTEKNGKPRMRKRSRCNGGIWADLKIISIVRVLW